MRIIGVISLYDEPIEWVDQSIFLACRLCDHMVIVDGAFRRFPHDSPRSPRDVIDAAERACELSRTPATVVTSEEAWPSQAAKMAAAFNLAEAFAEPWVDWMFVFAADEMLYCKPRLIRRHLPETNSDQIFVPFHTIQPDVFTRLTRWRATYPDDVRQISRIIRIHRHMRVEPPTHWHWTGLREDGERVSLHGLGRAGFPDGKTEVLPDGWCRIEHLTLLRDNENMRRKRKYATARARHDEDL